AEAISSPDELGVCQHLVGLDWLAHAPDESIRDLFRQLSGHLDSGRELNERFLAGTLRELVRRAYSGGSRRWKQLSDESREAAVELYQRLGPQVPCRYLLLQLLSVSRSPLDLAAFTDLVVDDPPTDITAAAVAFGPLLQNKEYEPDALFPRMLD